jgi:hypothetical protein
VFAIAAVFAVAAGASDLAALLDAASVARHLEEWPEVNEVARERSREALGPEVFALLSREVEATLSSARLLERVEPRLAGLELAGLRAGYAGTHAAGLLGDVHGLSAAELRDFPAFASELSRRRIPPARFGLVAKLDDSSGFGRDVWRVTQAWRRAIDGGTRALRCEGRSSWRAPAAPDPALAQSFRERVHVELLFLTREIDTADLRRAIRLLESEPARAFHQALGDATDAALEGALLALRERLAPAVRERCP